MTTRVPPASGYCINSQTYFSQLVRWIELESAAEALRIAARRQRAKGTDLEQTGETLLDLVIEDHDTGLGGRYLLTFAKRNRSQALPWNRLRVGSPVALSSEEDIEQVCSAIVSDRTTRTIQLAMEDWPEGDRFRIDLAPDEVTRRRQLAALRIAQEGRGQTARWRGLLLGELQPSFIEPKPCAYADGLNASQRDAISFALTAANLAIIHGPPGTGKTTTIVELIRQTVLRGEKILACAPSNTAVDNLVERLARTGTRVVRLGHPARVNAELRIHALDAIVERHENTRIVRQLTQKVDQLFRRADRHTRAKPERGARQALRQEAREIKDEIRFLQQQAIQHTIDRADVLCATTTLDDELLGDRRFDLLVIDEACQATEAACWVPLLRAERVVLAGDPYQLPPTVISTQAAQEGFSKSLLERMMELHGLQITRRLDVQYRMHQQIMAFSSEQFYDGSLIADDRVMVHLLADLPDVQTNQLTQEPITFFDTAGTSWEDELEPDGESRLNPEEGAFVLKIIRQLIEAGVSARDIGLIAPYAAQVRWLRQQFLDPQLEIDTVDGFQGREKEVIVISLVRSNQDGEIGFLSDTRRMNVALTRARRKLVVVGDSSTLAVHPFYAALLNYFESIGAYRTVWEQEYLS